MESSLVPEGGAVISRSSLSYSARERTASLLDRMIFSGLLMLIVLTAIPYGTVEPWWEAVFECSVFALAALALIESLLSPGQRVRELRLLLPLFALVVFAFIQSLPLLGPVAEPEATEGWRHALSADPYQTRLFALKVLAIALTLLLLLRYTSSPQRLRALIYLVIGVGVASALFGILRQTTQRDTPGFFLHYLFPNLGYGQFINKNHFAFLMEMPLGLILGLVVAGSVRRDRLLIYLALAMPMWTALVLSNSRGGILSLLSQVLFVALLFSIIRPRREFSEGRSTDVGWRRIGSLLVVRAALIVCLLAALVVGIVWIGGDPVVDRLESVPGELSAGSTQQREGVSRVQMWHATWRLIKDNPIAGVGFGGYWIAISQYHDASGVFLPHEAHNDYLELLASGGVIGAALGAWFVMALISRARVQLRSKDRYRRAACFGGLVGLCGIAAHSFVEFGLHVLVNPLVLVALLVMVTADQRVENASRPEG